MSKIVVFKASFRAKPDPSYDRLYPNEFEARALPPDVTIDYVLFTNLRAPCTEHGWQIRPEVFQDADCCRRARHHKACPHLLFPDADYTLFLDGVFTLKTHPLDLIKEYGSGDIVAHTHPARCCIYQEAYKCRKVGKDNAQVLRAQEKRYRMLGYPPRRGLHETGALMRKNNRMVTTFNERWWDEIRAGSKRDQISFDFCLWKTQLNVREWRGETKASPHFRWRAHHH